MGKKVVWKHLNARIQKAGQGEGREFWQKYRDAASGYVSLNECHEISDEGLVNFYFRMSRVASDTSPVKKRVDSRWMKQGHIMFVDFKHENGMAAGILDVLKILPSLPFDSVQLAPFTQCQDAERRLIESHSRIDSVLVSSFFSNLDIEPDEQLSLLVSAAHLLGKTIGFTLATTVSAFSPAVIHRPEYFSWIKTFQEDRVFLDYDMTPEDVYTEGNQKKLHNEIKNLTARLITSKTDIKEIIRTITDAGYWPVPLSDKDQEQPLFTGYDENGPVFTSKTGSRFRAFSESYATFFLLKNNGVSEYLSGIAALWMKKYCYDFISFSGFHGNQEEDLINKVYEKFSSAGQKYTGCIINDWEENAFFLETQKAVVSGLRCRESVSPLWLKQILEYSQLLYKKNKGERILSSCIFNVHTPLTALNRTDNLFIRHFTALFAHPDLSFRPVLSDSQLWSGQTALQNQYLIYMRFRQLLKKGHYLTSKINDSCGWWLITHKREMLLCIVFFSGSDSCLLDFSDIIPENTFLTVIEYDFNGLNGQSYLALENKLTVRRSPGSYQLLHIIW